MNISLESLGVSREQLIEMVVQGIVDQCMGNTSGVDDSISRDVQKTYKEAIANGVNRIATEAVLPKVEEILAKVTFQQTNYMGEPKGEPMTLKEHLLSKAEAWMTERVDYSGKTKAEESYNWEPTQTRVSHMIHEHLHYHIDKSVKAALADVNSKISAGIADTVRLKLHEAMQSLTITTNIK
jgi:hypothetical protein